MYNVELQKLVNGVWEFLDCCCGGDVEDKIKALKGFAVSRSNGILEDRLENTTEVRLVKENNAEPDGLEILKYWEKVQEGWSGWHVLADVT